MTQNPPNTASVLILDKEYRVACPDEERDALISAARYLDSKMREIRRNGKTIGLERIAVMAALNITYELLHDDSGEKGSPQSRERIEQLIKKLDSALDTSRQLEF
ncbi:cell division protein ZapA [Aestuariirhabdus litorea]|uniref:Cell division protein ZapA n=1 Tax=Aestuariirhabdus litorea TaxID=2528527 RepID=A0A3P3VJT4_9GAMM|nr:cell division protein ZapA [Aestuariirhabdus litorea]RRJ82991.1 cell division protein ZapA [Aestuariirhabdus litorea]RWW93150.1 cell division protein ZapA [Endozoicomonadaceae bacterium GTF-13]